MFTAAIHKGPHGLLVVVTDTNILDKIFTEGNRELNLNGAFFQGEKKSKDEIVVLLREARHLYLTGTHIIELALNLELIDASKILWVEGVPHAQAFCES